MLLMMFPFWKGIANLPAWVSWIITGDGVGFLFVFHGFPALPGLVVGEQTQHQQLVQDLGLFAECPS